jgi:hypothetical protein
VVSRACFSTPGDEVLPMPKLKERDNWFLFLAISFGYLSVKRVARSEVAGFGFSGSDVRGLSRAFGWRST